MSYNPDKHHRRSIRLKGYDYGQAGAYYFTICCHQRRCLLGEIVDGVMHPNLIGATVEAVWNNLPRHFPFIELDAFVLMPNHVHGIIVIKENQHNIDNRELLASKLTCETSLPNGTNPSALGAIIQNFKSVATRRVNRLNRSSGTIWQRDYYEEIIHNEKAHQNIRRYIIENPLNWDKDKENIINKL
ncbi:MAG: transposase [Cyanobacteriota bacterium]